ncbi:ribosomal protein L35, partial [Atractiella rhizophila]
SLPLSAAFSLPHSARAFSVSSPAFLLRKPTKYKLKTHKGAAKRFIVVANGQFKRMRAGKRHKTSKKSPASLNRLGERVYAKGYEIWKLKRLLPYA